jgi:hypothetical protein
MYIVDVGKALADDAWLAGTVRLHLADESVQRGPAVEPKTDDLPEEVGSERVVIAAVSRLADSLGDATLDEATCFGADAGLADVELLGELVEGAGLVREQKSAEEAASDAGETIAFGGQSHALDEGVSVGHGGLIFGTFNIN